MVAVVLLKLAAASPFVSAAGTSSFSFVAVSYTSTINLGALLITAGVGVMTLVTLLFGVRYRETNKLLESERRAQEDRAERLDKELADQREMHLAYREEKHRIVNEVTGKLVAVAAELEIERTKHDYTAVVAQVAALVEQQKQTGDILERVVRLLDLTVDKANGQAGGEQK